MCAAGSNGGVCVKAAAQAGFTLLELLVVLVLATLMLSLVVPRFAAVVPGVELKSTTQKTASLLRHARSRAMAESRLIAIDLDPDVHALRLSHREGPVVLPDSIALSLSDAGSLALGHEILAPLSLEASAPGPSIRFYPDGSSSGGSLLLSGPSGRYRIDVDWLTGRVHIDDGTPVEAVPNG
ncbi:type II secretion system protein GspH [Marinobacterium aestuarii]|uniref:Type II secretion system protein H n=1 Tax=Marinobacterium aestuarii TaxID=1821621 RepID=A0A1A9F0V1_9GAMM|nr:GspH/FimT family pseudopilin [Marinobacterium aestuarii]ANG63777.1 type II secretion system protein GspH [Marinobacterium aestuarii]